MRSNEALWKRVKAEVLRSNKGGNPGQWSARKAQLSVQLYKKRGGKYSGPLSKSAKSLKRWSSQKWRTYSGKRSRDSHERYLPSKAWTKLSPKERSQFNRSKQKAYSKHKQYAKYPKSYSKIKKYVNGNN